MSNFFRSFPITRYRFGNEETTVGFQKLNAYIDLIDQVKDLSTYYELYDVQEFERPDTLSHKLYKTSNYGWTFFLLNEKIRKHGWPMSNLDLYRMSHEYYPNIVLTTTHNISYTGNIQVGDTVRLFSDENQTGEVVRIDYDLGQIYIKRSTFFSINSGYLINVNSDLLINQAVQYTSQLRQYDAVHHYENDSGYYVDILESAGAQTSIDTLKFNTTGLNKITYTERLININYDLKKIKVFKPNVIETIVSEFNRLLQES